MTPSPLLGPSDNDDGHDPRIFRAGWDAKIEGREVLANPHDMGTWEWKAWRAGWYDALEERLKDAHRA